MKEWLGEQKAEALGDTNRYYFHEHYGKDAESDDELMMYYVTSGAEIFSKLHKQDAYVSS
jgi:hypothetical protein